MGRFNWYSPTGYYIEKERRANDKYAGLFDGRQLRDLESETEMVGVEIKKMKKSERMEKVKEQRRVGTGMNFYDPLGFEERKIR